MNYDELAGINQSSLKHFHRCRSLAHAAQALQKKYDNETLSFGRLVHSLILEPHLFAEQYVVADKPDCRTTAGKKTWADTLAVCEAQRKSLVSTADYDQAQRMALATRMHPQACALLYSPLSSPAATRHFEQTLQATLEDELGQPHKAKGRADLIIANEYTNTVIVDLKTTEDASLHGFRKSCRDFAYHLQAAFYIDLLLALGYHAPKFIFVAVEKHPPYGVQVFEASENFIVQGRVAYQRALKLYGEYQKKALIFADLPAYDDGIVELDLA